VPPPGANGTISRIGLVGYRSCALAQIAGSATNTAKIATTRNMVFSVIIYRGSFFDAD
jgi:hypothetical protein